MRLVDRAALRLHARAVNDRERADARELLDAVSHELRAKISELEVQNADLVGKLADAKAPSPPRYCAPCRFPHR
jgi:hypothetical protein